MSAKKLPQTLGKATEFHLDSWPLMHNFATMSSSSWLGLLFEQHLGKLLTWNTGSPTFRATVLFNDQGSFSHHIDFMASEATSRCVPGLTVSSLSMIQRSGHLGRVTVN